MPQLSGQRALLLPLLRLVTISSREAQNTTQTSIAKFARTLFISVLRAAKPRRMITKTHTVLRIFIAVNSRFILCYFFVQFKNKWPSHPGCAQMYHIWSVRCITADSTKAPIILHVQPLHHHLMKVWIKLRAFSSAMPTIMQANKCQFCSADKTGICGTTDLGFAQMWKQKSIADQVPDFILNNPISITKIALVLNAFTCHTC